MSYEVDLEALKDFVVASVGLDVVAIDLLSKDDFCRSFIIDVNQSPSIIARIAWPHMPATVLESEMATLKYVRERTSIPVPAVLAFALSHPKLGACLLLENPPGIILQSIYPSLSLHQKSAIATHLAHYTLMLSQQHFPLLGSLHIDAESDFVVGAVVRPRFYLDGRAKLDLDRGPFGTVEEYFVACAQRELDCARLLMAQESSEEYRREVEEGRLQVERSMGLMIDTVKRLHDSLLTSSEGSSKDPDGVSGLSLTMPELNEKHIYVNKDDPSKIVSIVGWTCTTTHPLWHCARVPRLFRPSLLAQEDDEEKESLTAVFKRAILEHPSAQTIREGGSESLGARLVRALETDDTRQGLNDTCEYDAFKDGFLLVPALESIRATLPGHEDVKGLATLLDPTTLPGRVARITLMTHGSNALYLASAAASDGGSASSRSPRTPMKVLPGEGSAPATGKGTGGDALRQRVMSMHGGEGTGLSSLLSA